MAWNIILIFRLRLAQIKATVSMIIYFLALGVSLKWATNEQTI